MQELRADELYGIAKKVNRELEALPLHQHSAVTEMIRVGMQQRAIGVERADRERTMDHQERQLRLQEQQMGLMAAQSERAAASQVRPHLMGGAAGYRDQNVAAHEQGQAAGDSCVNSGEVGNRYATDQADGAGETAPVEEPATA